MDDFLDRCAEADPETAALMMALYNEGVRDRIVADGAKYPEWVCNLTKHWYEME